MSEDDLFAIPERPSSRRLAASDATSRSIPRPPGGHESASEPTLRAAANLPPAPKALVPPPAFNSAIQAANSPGSTKRDRYHIWQCMLWGAGMVASLAAILWWVILVAGVSDGIGTPIIWLLWAGLCQLAIAWLTRWSGVSAGIMGPVVIAPVLLFGIWLMFMGMFPVLAYCAGIVALHLFGGRLAAWIARAKAIRQMRDIERTRAKQPHGTTPQQPAAATPERSPAPRG